MVVTKAMFSGTVANLTLWLLQKKLVGFYRHLPKACVAALMAAKVADVMSSGMPSLLAACTSNRNQSC